MDDIKPEMKRLLNFIDGREPEDEFTRALDEAVQLVRKNEKWRAQNVQWTFALRGPKRSGEGLYDFADELSGKV